VIQFVANVRDRAKRKRLFEGHLSAETLRRLARRPGLMELAAETRTISFLVCRIRGFAELAESFAKDPEGLARLMRHAMTPIARAVLDRHGTVDRVMPGKLTAFFNAPLDDPQHAIHACGAAIAMIEAVEKVNRTLELTLRANGAPMEPVDIGIGISTGEAVVGNFGTDAEPVYTATGRAIRLAGTIERLSTAYGSAILVGDRTRALVERNFAFLEVDHVALDARESLPLFALLGTPLARANPRFMALKAFHDRIFESYRAREWDKARALIAQARALSGANPVLYDLYLQRIAHFETHPPGGNWTGAFAPAMS
jgi:adenylate cyclase